MANDLHFYDPLYEVLLFGANPTHGKLRSSFKGAKSSELRKSVTPFIACPEVSRLHWLNQAGFINLVFPSGSHSRFAHALGTLHLGNIALDAVTVTLKDGKRSETGTLRYHLEQKHWVEEFLISLFLHDIGHYPFSHVLEQNLGFRNSLGADFVSHEEVACQFIRGEGPIFEASRDKYKQEGISLKLVSDVFDMETGFDREIVCYLISSSNDYLSGREFSNLDKSLLEVMHELVSGIFDLDRIDHYRRDSFFTGLGHSFKPYVLLHGLSYECNSTGIKPESDPNKAAQGQISTLLFIREQLHKYCFGNLINISYSSMLNHALTLHLEESKSESKSKALSMITMSDGDLLACVTQSSNLFSSYLTKRIKNSAPLSCVFTFPRQSTLSKDDIVEAIKESDNTVVVGFSKYFEKRDKPWLKSDLSKLDQGKGYIFAVADKASVISGILKGIGVTGVATPNEDEIKDFAFYGEE